MALIEETADELGHPCKWAKTERLDCDAGLEARLKLERELYEEATAQIGELLKSGNYLVRVPVQVINRVDLETKQWVITVRYRVRFVSPETRARYEAFHRDMNSEFDRAGYRD